MLRPFKKIFVTAIGLMMIFPFSVNAATFEVANEANYDYIKLDDSALKNGHDLLIELRENQPVTVEFPDGRIEEFVYTTETVGNANTLASDSVIKNVTAKRTVKTADLVLYGKAEWANRSVSYIDDVYLANTSINTALSEHVEKITQRTASGNEYAKARTVGQVVTTEPASGVEFHTHFDFEMWLDPANSSRTFLKINDSYTEA